MPPSVRTHLPNPIWIVDSQTPKPDGFDPASLVLEAAGVGQAACSVLTRFELLAGMRSGERSPLRSLLDGLVNLEATVDVATRAGEWARTFRRSHPNLSSIDYLIAATAEVHGADLLTRNVKNFPMFPELESAI